MPWLSDTKSWCTTFEKQWQNSDKLSFANLAYENLRLRNWSTGFNLDDFFEEFSKQSPCIEQINPHSQFGDPPLTLFLSEDRSFFLELYVWMESHTSIHSHGFEGAFHILEGISLESEYKFELLHTIRESRWGKLVPQKLELLKPGCTRKISPGEGLIHRVLHLSKPTISLALRTVTSEVPQYTYSYGFLAVPSFPALPVVSQQRIFDWYLQHSERIPKTIIDNVIHYPDTWSKLLGSQRFQGLALKLALMYPHFEVVGSIERQRIYEALFTELKATPHKILLTAYEVLGEAWITWVKAQDADLKLDPDGFRKTVSETSVYKSFELSGDHFIKNLF